MGFRVAGVTEASLTSDVFVTCLLQHSWRGLAGLRLSPSTLSEGVHKLREPRIRGSETVSPKCSSPLLPDPDFFLTMEEGGRRTHRPRNQIRHIAVSGGWAEGGSGRGRGGRRVEAGWQKGALGFLGGFLRPWVQMGYVGLRAHTRNPHGVPLLQLYRQSRTSDFPKPKTPTLPETKMETPKGSYKDYSPSKIGLYGFPC